MTLREALKAAHKRGYTRFNAPDTCPHWCPDRAAWTAALDTEGWEVLPVDGGLLILGPCPEPDCGMGRAVEMSREDV